MFVIIAGGRDFDDYKLLKEKCDHFLKNQNKANTVIVSGRAKGADSLGERYACERNIKLRGMPADWNTYGKSAGFRRNEEMAKVADALIAFWDGESHGTKHMIETMKRLGKPVRIVTYERS